MVKKVRQLDIARELDISAPMVSRHARDGMPTHNVKLARKWYDTYVSPGLRKDARASRRADPMTHPGGKLAASLPLPRGELRAPVPVLGRALSALLTQAGEAMIVNLVDEGLIRVDQGATAFSCIVCALDDALEAVGIEAELWTLAEPNVHDPIVRERIEQRVAELLAIGGPDE
jgi:hypothetical protein